MICYGVDGGIRGGGGAHKDPQLHWEESYVIESEEQTIDKAVMLGSGFPCVDFWRCLLPESEWRVTASHSLGWGVVTKVQANQKEKVDQTLQQMWATGTAPHHPERSWLPWASTCRMCLGGEEGFGLSFFSLKNHSLFLNFIYLLVLCFGCAGSLLPPGLLSSCRERRPLSSCSMWAAHGSGFSRCQPLALGLAGFSHCGMWA